jgi:hypothetical protein
MWEDIQHFLLGRTKNVQALYCEVLRASLSLKCFDVEEKGKLE